MRIYCLCGAAPARALNEKEGFVTQVPDVDHPERILAAHVKDDPVNGLVLPERPVQTVRVGVLQFLASSPNVGGLEEGTKVHRHYPNVDVRRCSNCGAAFALEG